MTDYKPVDEMRRVLYGDLPMLKAAIDGSKKASKNPDDGSVPIRDIVNFVKGWTLNTCKKLSIADQYTLYAELEKFSARVEAVNAWMKEHSHD